MLAHIAAMLIQSASATYTPRKLSSAIAAVEIGVATPRPSAVLQHISTMLISETWGNPAATLSKNLWSRAGSPARIAGDEGLGLARMTGDAPLRRGRGWREKSALCRCSRKRYQRRGRVRTCKPWRFSNCFKLVVMRYGTITGRGISTTKSPTTVFSAA